MLLTTMHRLHVLQALVRAAALLLFRTRDDVAVVAAAFSCPSSCTASAHRWGQRQRRENNSSNNAFAVEIAMQMALSDMYMENDLVAIQASPNKPPRLCAVRPDKEDGVVPLCVRADDVETDLFADPREFNKNDSKKWTTDVSDEQVAYRYGEGFYGQRPVPSLGMVRCYITRGTSERGKIVYAEPSRAERGKNCVC